MNGVDDFAGPIDRYLLTKKCEDISFPGACVLKKTRQFYTGPDLRPGTPVESEARRGRGIFFFCRLSLTIPVLVPLSPMREFAVIYCYQAGPDLNPMTGKSGACSTPLA